MQVSTQDKGQSTSSLVNMRVRQMADGQLLAAWCCCTARDEDDPEFQAVYEEITKRALLPELH